MRTALTLLIAMLGAAGAAHPSKGDAGKALKRSHKDIKRSHKDIKSVSQERVYQESKALWRWDSTRGQFSEVKSPKAKGP